ncbi:hypothetical protein PBS_51710 [Paraburkholderia sp. 2C]
MPLTLVGPLLDPWDAYGTRHALHQAVKLLTKYAAARAGGIPINLIRGARDVYSQESAPPV